MPRPKAGCLRWRQALPVNLEQIFCFYPGPSGSITDLLRSATRTDPLCDFGDEAGGRHRLWLLRKPETIARLVTAFRDRPLFIADGHHRYETALTFREEMRRADATGGPPKGDNFVMMNPGSLQEEGVSVLPTT